LNGWVVVDGVDGVMIGAILLPLSDLIEKRTPSTSNFVINPDAVVLVPFLVPSYRRRPRSSIHNHHILPYYVIS
jgi:hypothetical protein